MKKNLYDLLGVRPNDDAENLKKAYREAAKASHPDHHGDDQGAAARFQQIVEAYSVLRDAERRAAYDQVLEFQRQPFRAKLKRVVSELKHHILHDAIAALVLAMVMAGGYTLYVRISETPVDQAARAAGGEPEGTIAFQTAQQNAAARDKPDRVAARLMPIVPHSAPSATNDRGGALDITEDEPVAGPTEQTTEVAGRDGHPGLAIAEPSAAGAADPGKTQGIQPLNRSEAQSADAALSVPAEHDFAPKPSASDRTVFDEKHGGRSSEPGGGNADDVKRPEVKVSARPLTAVKRRMASRPPFKQALLENKNNSACAGAQSCSGGVPPLFGVGP
jgi:curved DNA-binding protein CbpA